MNPVVLFAQNAPNSGGMFAGAAAFMIIVWLIGIAATAFWLWMLVDALVYQPTTEQKLLWFLVIFFLPVVGAVVYLLVGRSGQIGSVRRY